jgi:ABC-type transport system substrate-binding protein
MWEKLKAGDFEAWMGIGQSGPWAQHRDFGRDNSIGYHNPVAFDIIDSIQVTADPAEEDRLYRRLADVYRAEMPFTRVIPWSTTWFVHRRIRGMSTPFRAEPVTYMETLWTETVDE